MLLTLSGDLDIAVKDDLRRRLEEAEAQSDTLDVDLSAVEYADSTALGLLIASRKRLRERGGSLRIVAPSRQVRKLLDYAGLIDAFEIRDEPRAVEPG